MMESIVEKTTAATVVAIEANNDMEKQTTQRLNGFCQRLEGVSMSLWNIWEVAMGSSKETAAHPVPKPSKARQEASLSEPLLTPTKTLRESGNEDETTVLYLAYGSNLSAAKFQGSRRVRPISSINVIVPELDLTFDLPGVPYKEPCFANTRLRVDKDQNSTRRLSNDPIWSKGLIGVVYEVTKSDYAKIIATEGGGSSYTDIMVDCYELAAGLDTVNDEDKILGKAFKAHTLFAPADHSSRSRPDRDYAQPSARYLKLITDGAAENKLPLDYQKYLLSLQPYTITSLRQRVGQGLFIAAWGPIALLTIGLTALTADKNGLAPPWATRLTLMMFEYMWKSYDNAFKPLFGDGERTQQRSTKSIKSINVSVPGITALDEKKMLAMTAS